MLIQGCIDVNSYRGRRHNSVHGRAKVVDLGLRNSSYFRLPCQIGVCLFEGNDCYCLFCLSVDASLCWRVCELHSCVNASRPACSRFTPQSQCIVCQCWPPSSSRWLLLSNTHRSFNSSALGVSKEQSCCWPPRPARALSSMTTFSSAACLFSLFNISVSTLIYWRDCSSIQYCQTNYKMSKITILYNVIYLFINLYFLNVRESE